MIDWPRAGVKRPCARLCQLRRGNPALARLKPPQAEPNLAEPAGTGLAVQGSMPRSAIASARALVLIASLGSLAACSSDVETDPDLGGGGRGTTSSIATGAGGDDPGEGGAGGGPACEPYDQACNCADCDGSCVQACNYEPQWECFAPGPPGDGEFSCGGWENCVVGYHACIHVSPLGDGCVDYFCAEVPSDCTGDASCDCIAQYIDGAQFPTTCADGGNGEVTVEYQAYAEEPPWDAPWCGDATCGQDEGCYSCVTDGGMGDPYWECSVESPSIPGIQGCTTRWLPER